MTRARVAPFSSTCVAVLLGAFAGIELAAQSSQATFKASVDLVPISAIVRDDRGRLVTTLTAGDFEVLDKGERRRILDFQTDDASPITVALIVDMSGSMAVGQKLAFAREVVKHIVRGLREGHDEVALFTFDSSLHERQAFTTHPGSLETLLTAVRPFGSTSLYDAIADAARGIERRTVQRRAVLVMTDGVDTSSQLTPPEVSGLASSIDVPVYAVAAAPSSVVALPAERGEDRLADLRDLAAWTGGDLLWVGREIEAGVRAYQILRELRHQYLIAIESATDDQWRPIDVRVRNPRLTVRARSGYFGRP